MTQTQFAYLGNVIRELRIHDADDIARCGSLGAAIDRAMLHARMDQQALADRVNKSRQYIGLIINEERSCPARLLLDICDVTGSAAPLQWMCAHMGGEFYVDPVNAERARLKARLAALDARAA